LSYSPIVGAIIAGVTAFGQEDKEWA